MFIFERSVTTPYREQMREYLSNKIDRHTKVRKNIVRISCGRKHVAYAKIINGVFGVWLFLRQRSGWVAWEVKQVWADPEFRGKGHVDDLYKAAINDDGLLIASGKTQTKWARAFWYRLIKKQTFNIWAHNFSNLSERAQVFVQDGELISELDLYTDDLSESRKNDVRLLAYRRN